LFTAYFPLDKGSVAVDNLWIEANFGRTDLLERARLRSGGGNALFEGRGRDVERLGVSGELGEQGQYRNIAEWRALGSFDVPGAMFEIRTTDPIGFRISAVHVNDPIPGRSR
jgi:hypothetical protein